MESKTKPFVLSVKVVVRDDAGECLIIRRSPASRHNAGQWDFPGGKVDPGERFDEALIREVAEETGLQIELVGLAGFAESSAPDRTIVYLIMEARVFGGALQLSSEHTEATWVRPMAMTTLEMCGQFRQFAADYARRKA